MRETATSGFTARPAQRLTLWLDVRDRHRHASLEVEVMKRARRAKLLGATVFEGQMGFGTHGQLHREHVFSDDRPLSIVIVDVPERIQQFLGELAYLGRDIVATVEDVEIVDL